jgi:hypothetical protein
MTEFDFIESIPGFISLVDLNCRYLRVNNNLSTLFKDSVEGKIAGDKCCEQAREIKKLINSPVGTETNWEYHHDDICLAVCSKRCENFIINQAIDITDRKSLEQKLSALAKRQDALLKAIPEAAESGSSRRSSEELKTLVELLTQRPIIEKESTESLIKLEVELRENTAKIQNIEKLLFWDDTSLLGRIKELEIHQNNDNVNWHEIETSKKNIEKLSQIAGIIVNIPGGGRTIFVTLIIVNILTTFFVDIAARVVDIHEIIPIVRDAKP